MIRSVLTNSNTSAYALTKAGLAIGAGFLGASLVAILLGWIALGNTHSLTRRLESVVNYQKHQIIETKEANCKLKLYDILSGRAGTLLFRKLHALNPFFEKGISHTLEIVESIPSIKVCTSIFKEPKNSVGKNSKKLLGGLTPSDIKYANKVLGEVLETTMKKNIEGRKLKVPNHHRKNKIDKQKNGVSNQRISPTNTLSTISPPTSITVPIENKEEQKIPESNIESENKPEEIKNENCLLEISLNPKILKSEVKVCDN